MSGYTVTITPAGGQAGPQTTIQVDTTTGTARVVELIMRSAGGDGLAPQQLPAIDLVGLIAALTPTSAPAITATAEVATPVEAAAPVSTGRRRRATKARTAAKATPRKTAATRSRRRQAAETAAKETGKSGGRAYRRMPDQDEVVGVFQSSGSVRAVAEHYGVPRHTATGWLRRLRSMGVLAS